MEITNSGMDVTKTKENNKTKSSKRKVKFSKLICRRKEWKQINRNQKFRLLHT